MPSSKLYEIKRFSRNETASLIQILPSSHGPRRRPVPLAAVLEPVGDLCHRQPRPLGQRPLLVRRGVAVDLVGLLQRVAGLFLEAVDGLLAVPDGAGERELPPQPIFIYRTWKDVKGFFYFVANYSERF